MINNELSKSSHQQGMDRIKYKEWIRSDTSDR